MFLQAENFLSTESKLESKRLTDLLIEVFTGLNDLLNDVSVSLVLCITDLSLHQAPLVSQLPVNLSIHFIQLGIHLFSQVIQCLGNECIFDIRKHVEQLLATLELFIKLVVVLTQLVEPLGEVVSLVVTGVLEAVIELNQLFLDLLEVLLSVVFHDIEAI